MQGCLSYIGKITTLKKILNYQVPTQWEEITIKQQLEGERNAKDNPDLKSLALLAAYCKIPFEEIKRIPFHETKELLTALSFTKEQIPTDPISEFTYKGETYSVVQTLLESETQDFVSIASVSERPDALLYIIAILSKRKINGKFESLSDYNLQERAKHFEELPMTIVKRVESFFLFSAMILQLDSEQHLDQLNSNINESINSMISTLKKPSGSALYTRFAAAILRNFLKYLRHRWNKQYSGCKSPTDSFGWRFATRVLFVPTVS